MEIYLLCSSGFISAALSLLRRVVFIFTPVADEPVKFELVSGARFEPHLSALTGERLNVVPVIPLLEIVVLLS